MTRSALFNLVIIVLLMCMAVMGLLWWYVQRVDAQLNELNTQLSAKQEELSNLNQMTEAQEKLDVLTLDERSTTHLELLKHLGLEKMDINFTVNSREVKSVGDTSLITRMVQINVEQPYNEVMEFLNRMYGIGKLHMGGIELLKGTKVDMNDPVQLQMTGTIYSLEKQGELIASPVTAAVMTSSTEPFDSGTTDNPL